ncbi:hypothetical protein GCM10011506_01250 [Marivirga lumbricoides]|uniref:DUF4132 domain-containing protein n=1 Tax=Marivirga lumbricoides TaxID=1046115 RepID=A0ABQ1LAP9_9BACT|nr:hypothetical protein GCM10011506_01250 [Marivirga lumbricoides]
MGFFDKFFKSKKSSSVKVKSFAEEESEVIPDLKQLVLKQYEINGLSIEAINSHFLAPCLEVLLANSYEKNNYDHNPEAYREKYFLFLAITNLVYHYPFDEIIEGILSHFFKEGKPYYAISDLIRSGGSHLLTAHPEKHLIISSGSSILRIYHALYIRKDQNFSYALQVHSILNNARTSEFKDGFSILLEIATRRIVYETPWILSHLVIFKEYDRRTKLTTTYTDKKEEVILKLEKVLSDFNSSYIFNLELSKLLLITEHILYLERNEIFLKTNYRDRKKIGLKEIGEELEPFINAAKDSMPSFMDVWMYHGSFYFSSDISKLYKEITENLLSINKFSNSDYNRWLSVYQYIGKEHVKSFYSPLFDNYVKTQNFSDYATQQFTKYFYTFYGINESRPMPKKLVEGLCKIADANNNTFEREFLKQCYRSPISVSMLTSDSYGFYTGSKNALEESVLTIHSQFNAYVPSSVKSVNKGQYYQEEHELFALNIEGEDYKVPHSFTGVLNKILAERQVGVRLVPVPICSSKDYYGNTRYIATLSIINVTQFKYLTEQYIPLRFPELRGVRAYESISYINMEGKAFHEINSKDVFEGGEQVFSAGFAKNVKWSWFKETYVDQLRSKHKWYRAMDTLTSFAGTKNPNKKWVSDMNSIIDEMGEEQYFDELNSLIYESREEKSWFFDEYNKTLKGMIWSCILRSTERSLLIVKAVTELSYVKISGIGPRSTKTGNFCMEALANSPSEIAYGILQLMRLKSKYPRFVKAIDKYIEKYKANNKSNLEELEDKALPNFGFSQGVKTYNFKDVLLQLTFNKGKIAKTYIVNHKSQKTIPDVLKMQHAARFKEVTAEVKQISDILKGLQERLKSFWLYNRSWKFTEWNKYIFQHELMNPLIENMVWKSIDSEELFISKRDQLIQINGAIIELDEEEEVCLWHPVIADTEEINELLAYFKKNKLNQVERQIDREYYSFSPDELNEVENDRFANQQLEVRKLMALANSAGWVFTYVHEDVSWPRIYLKALDLTAHFKCDFDRTAEYIPSGSFFISKGDTTKISYSTKFDKLKLSTIPATTLSEVCRDIDMFVSVAKHKK